MFYKVTRSFLLTADAARIRNAGLNLCQTLIDATTRRGKLYREHSIIHGKHIVIFITDLAKFNIFNVCLSFILRAYWPIIQRRVAHAVAAATRDKVMMMACAFVLFNKISNAAATTARTTVYKISSSYWRCHFFLFVFKFAEKSYNIHHQEFYFIAVQTNYCV